MSVTEIPVRLGRINIGKTTARVGLKIDRGWLSLERADELFCERRLLGKLIAGGSDDAPGQTKFIEEETLEGAFDTKSFSVNEESISAGVTFALGEIDLAALPHFSAGSARLLVNEVTEIPQEVKAARAKEEKEQKSLAAEGPWRQTPVENIYGDKPRVVKALEEQELATMGDLADWLNSGKSYRDLKGVGEKAAEWMEEQDVEFWAQNPQDGDEDEDEDE